MASLELTPSIREELRTSLSSYLAILEAHKKIRQEMGLPRMDLFTGLHWSVARLNSDDVVTDANLDLLWSETLQFNKLKTGVHNPEKVNGQDQDQA